MQARIVTLPGDGVGTEVVAEATKVLGVVAERYGHRFVFEERPIGGTAIDVTGEPLPAETLSACCAADAVLLGAVGGPKWDDPAAAVRPEQGLLGLRQRLGLYANLRPVHVYAELIDASPIRSDLVDGVDLVIVRELTGGIYFGKRQESTGTPAAAYDTMRYTADEVERIAHVAFRVARRRHGHVTSVDKANVLASSRLWRRTVFEVAAEYPDVGAEPMLVDAAAMQLIRCPKAFDVILTTNMFGDILADEAAMLSGSIGMLPSASLGDGGCGLYEPVHGSAPDLSGRGCVNPIAAILSAAMLLRHALGLEAEADEVEAAVAKTLVDGHRTEDLCRDGIDPIGTAEMGDRIAERLVKRAEKEGSE